MEFSPNKTPINEGAFGGTYFREIYSDINKKWYKNSWKEFIHLKYIDPKFYPPDYYNINVNKYGLKCKTSLRFWESKVWINKIDLYGWFQWYFRYWLGRESKDDKRQINRWKKIVSISISPKIRQILLHRGYKLTKKDFELINKNKGLKRIL